MADLRAIQEENGMLQGKTTKEIVSDRPKQQKCNRRERDEIYIHICIVVVFT
jgi:hypothetical protein